MTAQSRDRKGLVELGRRLQAGRSELEQEALVRMYTVARPTGSEEAGYVDGLRSSVAAAIDYALEAIEAGDSPVGPPPPILLAQARLAARSQVGLDTVLRRYVSGYTLFGELLQTKAASIPHLDATTLQKLHRLQAELFDRLIAAITREYTAEAGENNRLSRENELPKKVERLLEGHMVDASSLGYPLNGSHVGIIASGLAAVSAVRNVGKALDRNVLVVDRGDRVWAWLGGRGAPDPALLGRQLCRMSAGGISVSVGEPARGLAGWRLTHRQAAAAWPIAARVAGEVVHYREVALVAAAMQDTMLATSLHQLYVAPLAGRQKDRVALRETLRAYFATGRNLTATAAVLNVARQTVRSRLRAAEERLCRSLDDCAPEVEVALSLDEIVGGATRTQPLAPQAASR